MKEILGENLEQFFNSEMKNYPTYKRTYKGDRYEVWKVSDKVFNIMCDMPEDKFVELAGEDAWWRSAEGSVMGIPDTIFHINGRKMLAWDYDKDYYEDWDDEELEPIKEFNSLTSYLCEVLGASQPRNICALAVDLAKHNHMTVARLFEKYEG